VLGTEDGRILILDVSGTRVQLSVRLTAAPSFLAVSGTLDSGSYRISATARDGRLHLVRAGEVNAVSVQLEAQPVGLVRIGHSALVGCMSDVVHCFGSKSGTARQYSLPQPAAIQCMQLLATHTSRMTKCLIVALANGGCWLRATAGGIWCDAVAAHQNRYTNTHALHASITTEPCHPAKQNTTQRQARCGCTTTGRSYLCTPLLQPHL